PRLRAGCLHPRREYYDRWWGKPRADGLKAGVRGWVLGAGFCEPPPPAFGLQPAIFWLLTSGSWILPSAFAILTAWDAFPPIPLCSRKFSPPLLLTRCAKSACSGSWSASPAELTRR